MWIYPLIVLVLMIGIFHFIDAARRINQSLQNKRQYYGFYRIRTLYTNRRKVMLGCVLVVLIALIVFVILPYTRGSIKMLSNDKIEDFYSQYYCEENKSSSQTLVDKISLSKMTDSSQKIGQRIVYISNNKLISKYISKENPKEVSFQYNDLRGVQIKIFQNYIFIYKNYDDYARLCIHKIDDLTLLEDAIFFGTIEMITATDGKLQFAINRKTLYNGLPIINFKSNGNSIYLDNNESYYIPNNFFYQLLTFIEVDFNNHDYRIKTLCLNDYYLLEKGNSVYVATNIYDGSSKKACIMRFNKDLSTVTLMKESLEGELYKEPVISGDDILCYTAIFNSDNNTFIRTTLNDYLLVIDKSRYNGNFNQTALKVDGQVVFACQDGQEINLYDEDEMINFNMNEVCLINQTLFQVINNQNDFKVYKINYDGTFNSQIVFFDNVRYDNYKIYSCEENIYLIYEYQDKVGYKVKNKNDNYAIDKQYEKSQGYQVCVIDSEILIISSKQTTTVVMN